MPHPSMLSKSPSTCLDCPVLLAQLEQASKHLSASDAQLVQLTRDDRILLACVRELSLVVGAAGEEDVVGKG